MHSVQRLAGKTPLPAMAATVPARLYKQRRPREAVAVGVSVSAIFDWIVPPREVERLRDAVLYPA